MTPGEAVPVVEHARPVFSVECREVGDVAVVRPIGDLDVATMSSFQLRVASILEAGTRHLVVDLSGVPFMDSSGLASLVHLFKTARASQGDLRLAGPRTDLVRLLEITHLNRVFAVYDSEAACLASFR